MCVYSVRHHYRHQPCTGTHLSSGLSKDVAEKKLFFRLRTFAVFQVFIFCGKTEWAMAQAWHQVNPRKGAAYYLYKYTEIKKYVYILKHVHTMCTHTCRVLAKAKWACGRACEHGHGVHRADTLFRQTQRTFGNRSGRTHARHEGRSQPIWQASKGRGTASTKHPA